MPDNIPMTTFVKKFRRLLIRSLIFFFMWTGLYNSSLPFFCQNESNASSQKLQQVLDKNCSSSHKSSSKVPFHHQHKSCADSNCSTHSLATQISESPLLPVPLWKFRYSFVPKQLTPRDSIFSPFKPPSLV